MSRRCDRRVSRRWRDRRDIIEDSIVLGLVLNKAPQVQIVAYIEVYGVGPYFIWELDPLYTALVGLAMDGAQLDSRFITLIQLKPMRDVLPFYQQLGVVLEERDAVGQHHALSLPRIQQAWSACVEARAAMRGA